MRRRVFVSLAVCAVLSSAVYFDRQAAEAEANAGISMNSPSKVTLSAAPIPAAWILEGDPQAQAGLVAKTADGTTKLIVWRVSAGRFNWHYDFDETVTILDGDVYLTDQAGAAAHNPGERHLGPGDVALFRRGASATWRVPDHVRKIATVRTHPPELVASLQRFGRALKSLLGMTTASLL